MGYVLRRMKNQKKKTIYRFSNIDSQVENTEAYLREGDVVLIKSKMVRRNGWLFGRVVDCKISEDGLVIPVSLRLPLLPGINIPRTTKRCIQYPWPGTHCSFCETFYRMYQILPMNKVLRHSVNVYLNKPCDSLKQTTWSVSTNRMACFGRVYAMS